MGKFSKRLVNSASEINSIMHSTIGASWDFIRIEEGKYPKEYPAVLIIDEVSENKNFDYIYPSIFDGDTRCVGDCVYFEYCQGRSKCHHPEIPFTKCNGVCDKFEKNLNEREYLK